MVPQGSELEASRTGGLIGKMKSPDLDSSEFEVLVRRQPPGLKATEGSKLEESRRS